MATTETYTIPWAPFTEKHRRYIHRAQVERISIAEGAIRSGKTIDNCIVAAAYLETCADRIHLASGSSAPNAKLNIGDCNGFGLEYLFRGRCRWGKYKGNEALFIATQTGEKIIIFVGGGKADSYKKILGNSYGLWIATEINEHYDNEDSRVSFVKVAMGRQIAASNPKILWDLNPSAPSASIYTDYIDKYRDEGLCNYELFTLHDNGSLTPDRIAEIEQRYIPGTIWHTRDILGQRCVAEGLIYRHFADNKARYKISFAKASDGALEMPRFRDIVLGADWGGNKSYHAFTAVGITQDYGVIALASERHVATDTDADFVSQKFNEFYDKVQGKYGKPTDAYGDSEGQTLKNTVSHKGRIWLRNSKKHKIKNRIDAMMYLVATGRFAYTEDCDTLVGALCTAQWDPKHPDERLDNGTSDIDTLDSFEYTWERYIPYMTRG